MSEKIQGLNSSTLAWLENARLIDDIFMCICLRDNFECVEFVLQTVMNDKELEILDVESQADLKSASSRSIELDFLAKSSDGTLYDIEIESGLSNFTPRRGKYHASMLDSNSLKPGARFENLPNSVVIILSEEDLLGENELRTVVKRAYGKDAKSYEDGSAIIYVNCKAADESELGKIAHDFLCSDPAEMYIRILAKAASQHKPLKVGGKMAFRYTEKPQSSNPYEQNLIDLLYDAGEKDGFEQGLEQGRTNAFEVVAERMRTQGMSEDLIESIIRKESADCS